MLACYDSSTPVAAHTHLSSRVMPAHGPNRVSRSNARSTCSSWLMSPVAGHAGAHSEYRAQAPAAAAAQRNQTNTPAPSHYNTRQTAPSAAKHSLSVTASVPVTPGRGGCSLLEGFLLPLLLRSTPAFRCLKWSVTRAVAISVVVWAPAAREFGPALLLCCCSPG